MDITDQNRILESVKESITETTQKTEEAASYFIIGLAAAIIIAVVIVLGAVASKKAKISSYDAQIKTDVTDQLKNLDKEQNQINSVFTQLDVLETALSKRLKYSQMMNELAKNSYQKSKWKNITVKGDQITITGEAANFDDVARSVIALKGLTSVKSAKLTAAALDQENQVVSFSVDLVMNMKNYANPIVKPTSTATASEVIQ